MSQGPAGLLCHWKIVPSSTVGDHIVCRQNDRRHSYLGTFADHHVG